MNPIQQIYQTLLKTYSPQGWWPIINNKTLLCEYHTGAPKNDAERLEICIGAILAQNTQWYPNVVRALQQLKIGRVLTKQELEVIQKAEILQAEISKNSKKETKSNILTQNTSWSHVEKALQNLAAETIITATGLKKLDEDVLKNAVKPAGYFNQKAKKILLFIDFYDSLEGRIPTRDELLSVWGIGKETADSILLYAYSISTFVVDAYTRRIFSAMGFIDKNAEYDEIQKFFMDNLPKDIVVYQEFHALIVEHAKRSCRTKPECQQCILKINCNF